MPNNFAMPVLMYHHVNPEGNFINVKPDIFEGHLRLIKSNGYTTLDSEDFLSVINGDKPVPPKPIMITFDDGWLDNWLFAFLLLKKYQMKAIIFVITSQLADNGKRQRADEGAVSPLPVHKECQKFVEQGRGDEVMLSWDELREMGKSGLVDIQSHTHTHQRWDKINSDDEQRRKILDEELRISKRLIEEGLGKKCRAVCWPWGKYSEEYIELAKSSGYELMFTTEKGTNTQDTEPWRIKRLTIGNISPFSLKKKLLIHSRGWLSRAYLRYFE
jgi:peptidoglycan/xylan/chitin deacetylase (PgdA/CDA1 family)